MVDGDLDDGRGPRGYVDFVSSHLLTGRPPSLFLVATGNMGNAELHRLSEDNIGILEDALTSHRFIVLGRDSLALHA